MTWPVFSGGEKDAIEAHEKRESAELFLMMFGAGRRTIFLNGGSDTRSAAIEFWREWASAAGIKFNQRGRCMIVLGGGGND